MLFSAQTKEINQGPIVCCFVATINAYGGLVGLWTVPKVCEEKADDAGFEDDETAAQANWFGLVQDGKCSALNEPTRHTVHSALPKFNPQLIS